MCVCVGGGGGGGGAGVEMSMTEEKKGGGELSLDFPHVRVSELSINYFIVGPCGIVGMLLTRWGWRKGEKGREKEGGGGREMGE